MTGKIKEMIGRLGGKAVLAATVIMLLVPSSSSVLCISPGNHIAIENISALCCASSTLTLLSGNRPDAEFGVSSSCNNCTDVLLAGNESGVPSDSGNFMVAGPPNAEFLDTSPSADLNAPPFRSANICSADSSLSTDSPTPLRR